MIPQLPSAELSRRNLLELGATSAAAVSQLSLFPDLTGCRSEPPNNGFLVLRPADLISLNAT